MREGVGCGQIAKNDAVCAEVRVQKLQSKIPHPVIHFSQIAIREEGITSNITINRLRETPTSISANLFTKYNNSLAISANVYQLSVIVSETI